MSNQRYYQVRKIDEYLGLWDKNVFITDNSTTSPNYFVLSAVPQELTAGKNMIKIAGNPLTMRLSTNIYVEALDANNSPLYTEVHDYVDNELRRVITIYVYPETLAGPVRISVLGTAYRYYDGSFLREIPDEWKTELNVKWNLSIYASPTKRNDTEIIFNDLPYIFVREIYKRSYISELTPGEDIEIQPSASLGYRNIQAENISLLSRIDRDIRRESPPILVEPDPDLSDDIRDEVGDRSDVIRIFNPRTVIRGDDTITRDGNIRDLNDRDRIYVPGISTPTTRIFTRLEEAPILDDRTTTVTTEVQYPSSITTGDRVLIRVLSPTAIIVNPGFQFRRYMKDAVIVVRDPQGLNLPSGYTYVDNSDQAYKTTIKEVISSGEIALADPYERSLVRTDSSLDTITWQPQRFRSSDFEISYSEEPTWVESEKYTSNAYIEMGNINPITGNVHTIKAYGRSHSSQFGYTYLGEQILTATNFFIDTSSISAEDPVGIFTQDIIDTFWTASTHGNASIVTLETGSDVLVDAMHISGSEITQDTETDFWKITVPGYKNRYFGNTGYNLILNIDGQSRQGLPGKIQFLLSGSAMYQDDLLIAELYVPEKDRTRYYDLTIPFKTDIAGYGTPIIKVYGGDWRIANMRLQPIHEVGFAPQHTVFTIPINTAWDGDYIDFKFEFYDYKGNMSNTYLLYNNVDFEKGPAHFIQGGDNLVSGSIFFGNVLYEGIEMAGLNSAYMRNIGYNGWTSGSQGHYGFMMWSGSVLPSETWDAYDGVGVELIGASGSMRFRTEPSLFEIQADRFFVGNYNSQFISGAAGDIEISSSDFHLRPDGSVIIGADATIYGSLAVNQLLVPTTGPPYLAAIYPDGRAEFTNVDIQGTLKTTVFEKETINAVGGQLLVSNSTTISGSIVYASDTTMSFANAGGFRTGEYLIAKATSSTGFQTEYMQIVSSGVSGSTGSIAGTASETSGDAPWAAASYHCITASNGIYAYSPGLSVGEYTNELNGTNFGFSIPESVDILGVEFQIAFSASQAADNLPVLNESLIELLGTGVSSNNKASGQFTASIGSSVRTWGGSLDNWGAGLTPTKVNDSSFGVSLQVQASSSFGPQFYVDYFQLTIYYEEVTGDITVTRDVASTGTIPTMSESQVIVSLARSGSGYIHMNAYPNDASTPYIDIVERTGSGVNDTEIKARLGDLSGLAGVGPVSSNPGYGLYSQNVFLSGTITASAGLIGGFNIGSEYLQDTNNGNLVLNGTLGQVTASAANLANWEVSIPGGYGRILGGKNTSGSLMLSHHAAGAQIWWGRISDVDFSEYFYIYGTTGKKMYFQVGAGNGSDHDGVEWVGQNVSTDPVPLVYRDWSSITFQQSIYASAYYFYGDTDTYINDVASDTIGFICGGSEGARVTSNGISVANGTVSIPGFRFTSDSNTGFFWTNVLSDGIGVSMDGSLTYLFEKDGDFHAQTSVVTPSAYSDINLKENINLLSNSLTKVLNLNGVNFNWKDWNKKDRDMHVGLIAQEVEKYIPEVVFEKQIPFKEGDATMYKMIKYEQLVPYLIESIKELNKKVEKLEKDLEN